MNVNGYKEWGQITGKPINYTDSRGTRQYIKPTARENYRYFFNYQLGWLNMRYFFWNFVGRQNDNLSVGLPHHGNWMSGINFIDKGRTGSKTALPARYQDKSTNHFFFLPLILGLVGLYFLFSRNKLFTVITGIGFLAFSFAITVFINQEPIHVIIRDRDYIFLVAYFIFALWIGLGVIGLSNLIPGVLKSRQKTIGVVAVCFVLVPLLMGFKGWNDHNRSSDDFPENFARSYLDACPENALLITNGDNATFPLWYLQQVEGYRTDVRVINFDMLGLDWYIDKLQRRMNDSPPVKMSMARNTYLKGAEKLLPLQEQMPEGQYLDLKRVVDFATSPEERTMWNYRNINMMPTARFGLAADSNILIAQGIDPTKFGAHFTPQVTWTYRQDFYPRGDLVLMLSLIHI